MEAIEKLKNPIYIEELDGWVAYRDVLKDRLMFIKTEDYTKDVFQDAERVKSVNKIAHAEFTKTGTLPTKLAELV